MEGCEKRRAEQGILPFYSMYHSLLLTSILIVNEDPTIQRRDHRVTPYDDLLVLVCGIVMYRCESYLVTACMKFARVAYGMTDVLAVSIQSVRGQSVRAERDLGLTVLLRKY
jgi:hypothetical protein